MAFLGGHPLSMRLILPHLERVDAQALLGGWLDNQIHTGRAETAMAVLSIEKPSFLRMLQEALGNRPGMALSYGQLGLLA